MNVSSAAALLPSKLYGVTDDPTVLRCVEHCGRDSGLDLQLAPTITEFIAAYTPDCPSCLVLDVEDPGDREADLLASLKTGRAPIGVIGIGEEGSVSLAVRTLRAGALHFVEKPVDESALQDAVADVLLEASRRFTVRQKWRDFEARLDDLTDREREILGHVVQGKANKLIASDLGISERTVEVHRFRVLRKMNISSAVELACLVGAFEAGGGSISRVSVTRTPSSSFAA